MAEDEPDGLVVEIDEIAPGVEEMDDGSALVDMGGDEPPGESEFYANLADTLPFIELASLASDLLDLISHDKEARKKRDEQYAEGLRRTGLGDDAPGGAQFQGASRVVHPMLTEGCVDFAARTMKELMPPSGPVKESIPGKVTQAKLAKARRKTNFMNWQLTIQCKEFRAELEQLMTQVPMGGDQYLKVGWNHKRNRPDFLFVGIDEMLLPFSATNFYTAQRRTHVEAVTRVEYQQRVQSGEWRDVDLAPAGMEPEQTRAAMANDKIEGRSPSSYNKDGLRTTFCVYAILHMPGDAKVEDDELAPYIITIDEPTRQVLAVYRNWAEDDETRDELQWFVQWPFVPWRGAYSIGLPHMIGGLVAAATGALRALLDSAHINNTPSLLKLKGAKIGGQNTSPQPGEALEIEGGINVDDIRKVAMSLPFNPPSTVLFELLGFLVNAGNGVVRTSLDEIADQTGDVPVGTTLARIEQGLTVYGSVFGRQHDAMNRLLAILHRLNGQYLDDAAIEREAGEALATRADFDGPLDVVPVSDPSVFSETQRMTRAQLIVQRADATKDYGLYDPRKVEEYYLTAMKVPEGLDLLRPAPMAKEQNAVNENVAASLGRPVTAFPEQDHLAHLATHIAYMQAPMFGGSPLIAQGFLPVMMSHFREHIALWYASEVFKLASHALGGDLGDFMREMDGEPSVEARKELDRTLEQAGSAALAEANGLFAQLPPIIAQAQQVLQQMQQPPPQDPLIALQAKQIDTDAALRREDMAKDAKEHADDMALEHQKLAANIQTKGADTQARVGMNTQDNQVALELAGMRAGHVPMNPNPRP